ncbi:hypothetical protein SFRURICE_014210 [Spodoptera frugiperda]|nr:hypothetical protein SFRURICE_014210 [Spodoptera frugiperda]
MGGSEARESECVTEIRLSCREWVTLKHAYVILTEVPEAQGRPMRGVGQKSERTRTSGGEQRTLTVTRARAARRRMAIMRNAVTVPDNCPPGHKMGADGVCRHLAQASAQRILVASIGCEEAVLVPMTVQ